MKNETYEEFIARGGKVIKCKTKEIRKYSSIPSFYLPPKKAKGVDPQQLLDAATSTEHEAEVVAFLQSQGYEVS